MNQAHTHTAAIYSGQRLTWTILVNIVITVAEFVAGFLSGYLALIADAVHNLSDVAALVLAWLGMKGSQLPATKRSTYGYKRIEVMTAFVSAVALVVIAIFILHEAFERYLNPVPINRPWLFLTVAAIGLCGNLASVILLHRDKDNSLNLKTAFLHMAYDTASSVIVLAGGVVILLTGWLVVDVVLSSAIALMIFWSSYLVIKEAVMILMEAVPDRINFDRVHRAINGLPDVKSVHDLHIWSLSSTDFAMSCHICLEDDDIPRGFEVIARINGLMAEAFGIGHCTVQIESEVCERNGLLCGRPADDGEQA